MHRFYLGIDIAWGDKKGDGLCLIEADRERAKVVSIDYTHGDEALMAWVKARVPTDAAALVTIDGPIVILNETGTRPIDRLTHRLFHRQHAACHPANLNRCPRPPRVRRLFEQIDFVTGWDAALGTRLVAEVYPHPAMVRFFQLERILKYKKGSITERRLEFKRLQKLLKHLLKNEFPELEIGREATALLKAEWTKPVEDRLDGFFCALIGYHHGKHAGLRSEVIGELETGFILLPTEVRQTIKL